MGRETLWFAWAHNDAGRMPRFNIEAFVVSEDFDPEDEVCGLPVIRGEDEAFGRGESRVVCAIGDPRERREVVRRLRRYNVGFATIIHPGAIVSESAAIAPGCIIGPHATISVNTNLGEHVIINVNASISHDDQIGAFATLAPGVHIAGNAVIGEGVELGTNAAVINGIRIGQGAIIGAGAVVTRDLPPDCVAVGVPAKVLHELPPERHW